ncbi:SGNH/GDSL hydrolase family protein [Paenibacillus taiwanensis]|uniref:SGNH/GDSL hydrolase family protein n=1 Tax=Paenibacillus taiwanensis TaxID=401638 RepID=UPI000429D234|nr:SGNH/GDSL hydrolase family protein [Paenibacillus taiwanensis]
MSHTSQLVAAQYRNGELNKRMFGDAFYIATAYGVFPDGSNVTSQLQALVSLAKSQNRSTIFFPHGDYYVTQLSDYEGIYFFGDNSKFVGGFAEEIYQIGVSKNMNLIYLPYKIMTSVDTFNDLRNWYPTDDTGVKNKDWVVQDNKLKINPENVTNSLWNNYKMQDGKLSLIWENPVISNENLTYVGILFRGNSFKDYYSAHFYAGNYSSNANKVIISKTTNGSLNVLAQTTLIDPSAMLKDNTNINLEVEFYGSYVQVFVNGKKVLEYVGSNDSNVGLFGIQLPPSSMPGNSSSQLSNFCMKEWKYDDFKLDIKDMLVAGDSIALGIGASSNDKTWISIFGTKIRNVIPDLNITNIAIGGLNTTEVMIELGNYLNQDPYKYQAILISCGTNNARYDNNKRTTFEVAQSNICSMIKFIKNSNAIPILCIPPNFVYNVHELYPQTYASDSYDYFQKLVKMIRNVGISEKVIVIDNYQLFNNNSSFLSDGVHPNDDGYRLMADNLYTTLLGG